MSDNEVGKWADLPAEMKYTYLLEACRDVIAILQHAGPGAKNGADYLQRTLDRLGE